SSGGNWLIADSRRVASSSKPIQRSFWTSRPQSAGNGCTSRISGACCFIFIRSSHLLVFGQAPLPLLSRAPGRSAERRQRIGVRAVTIPSRGRSVAREISCAAPTRFAQSANSLEIAECRRFDPTNFVEIEVNGGHTAH